MRNRMAKAKRQYICQNCGAATYRWQGQCADCGEWNTLVEEAVETVFSSKHDLSRGGGPLSLESTAAHTQIGRASVRDRVWLEATITVVPGSLTKNNKIK